MKLRGFDRVLLFIGALIIAAIGVGLLLVSLSIESLVIPSFEGEDLVINQFIIIFCAIFLLVFAIYTISLTLSPHRKKTEFVVQQSSGGELRISVLAIESLVRKVMAAHTDMSLKNMSVENIKDNVFIDLKIDIAGNVSIPLAVTSVQKDIRQHLLTSAGIEVKDVRVSVDMTDEEVELSPFIIPDSTPIAISGESPQEKKQKQSLFSRDTEMLYTPENFNHFENQESSDKASAPETNENHNSEGKDDYAGK